MWINTFQASARRRVFHVSLMNKSSPGQLWWTRPLLPVKPVELHAVVTPVNEANRHLLVMLERFGPLLISTMDYTGSTFLCMWLLEAAVKMMAHNHDYAPDQIQLFMILSHLFYVKHRVVRCGSRHRKQSKVSRESVWRTRRMFWFHPPIVSSREMAQMRDAVEFAWWMDQFVLACCLWGCSH